MVRTERPPNYARILDTFPNASNYGILFTYGQDIYNPSGGVIPDWLLAHEKKHCERQTDPEAWWEQYLTDDEFRYNEELIAHREEYRVQMKKTKDRNVRIKLAVVAAKRLVAPLYNYQPPRSLNQAIKDIREVGKPGVPASFGKKRTSVQI